MVNVEAVCVYHSPPSPAIQPISATVAPTRDAHADRGPPCELSAFYFAFGLGLRSSERGLGFGLGKLSNLC